MAIVNEVNNVLTSLIESGDIRIIVDVAIVVVVAWFIIRGVSRVFETLVLGVITVFAVNYLLGYFGIQVDYQAVITQVSYWLQQLIDFVNTALPKG